MGVFFPVFFFVLFFFSFSLLHSLHSFSPLFLGLGLLPAKPAPHGIMATTFLSGASFGAAMLAAGFHYPSIVVSQLKFDNWHMIQAFMTATAGSA